MIKSHGYSITLSFFKSAITSAAVLLAVAAHPYTRKQLCNSIARHVLTMLAVGALYAIGCANCVSNCVSRSCPHFPEIRSQGPGEPGSSKDTTGMTHGCSHWPGSGPEPVSTIVAARPIERCHVS